MIVCFVTLNDNMQMAFIKVVQCLCGITFKSVLHNAWSTSGWHCRTAHKFLYRPNTKEQKSMKLSMCFNHLQHAVYLNKKEIYIMYN